MFSVVCSPLLFVSLPQAHTVLPGSNDFTNGLLHPFLTPAHGLLLLGLGLWLGQRRPFTMGKPVLGFAAFALLGLALSFVLHTLPPLQPYLAALALVAGGLVALSARCPWWVIGALFALSGAVLGLDSNPELPSAFSATITVAGTWVSLILLVTNIAFYTSMLPPRQWVTIGVRVAGSWLAAISMLLIAFALRR